MENMDYIVEIDNIKFKMQIDIINKIDHIKNIILDNDDDNNIISIRTPDDIICVNEDIMCEIIDYIQKYNIEKKIKYKGDDSDLVIIPSWEKKFCEKYCEGNIYPNISDDKKIDLFNLINISNFLEAKHIVNCLCRFIATHLNGKSTKQMRLFYGIENDFSPEEEEIEKAKHAWIKGKK